MGRLFSRWGHGRWRDAVDAYVDGELSRQERKRFEAHLAFCQPCTVLVRERRTLKLMVSRMPEVTAPRSFRLTPEMAEQASGRPLAHADTARRPGWPLRTAQFTAGLAIVALTAVFAFDMTSGSSSTEYANKASGGQLTTMAAPESAAAATAASSEAERGQAAADSSAATAAATPVAPATGPQTQDSATPTAKGVVPPNGNDVGAQSVPPSPSAESTAFAYAQPGVGDTGGRATGEAPAQTELPAQGGAETQDTRAAKQSSNDNEAAFRSAELGLAAVAVLAAGAALFLKRRRRY